MAVNGADTTRKIVASCDEPSFAGTSVDPAIAATNAETNAAAIASQTTRT